MTAVGRFRWWAVVLAVLVLTWAGPARAGYETDLERGSFFLERGATYGPDAVRSLEAARDADPDRAGADPRWLLAAARAYALTSRFTEAYGLLERLLQRDPGNEAGRDLRDWLLGDAGLGRVRVVSAVPLDRVAARLEALDASRLDVAARRALGRLGELLARGVPAAPAGTTLLVPEGRYRFTLEPAPAVFAPTGPVTLEVWAGDEGRVRVVPRYPGPSGWDVRPAARTISLGWPPLAGATYRLVRETDLGDEPVWAGSGTRCTDTGLSVGQTVTYRLEALGPGGEVVAASRVSARTEPPVERVAAAAEIGPDLRVEVGWALGDGAADAVRVVREDPDGDRQLARLEPPESLVEGSVFDGPVVPGRSPRVLAYRVEAWVLGSDRPSAAARVEVPLAARVERVSAVVESVEGSGVVVAWETVPRDGLASGYRIYRVRGDGTAAERVGEVLDPFGREYYYEVADPLEAGGWRHFVVPLLDGRVVLDPDAFRVSEPETPRSFGRRARQNEELPDLGLSWDPVPGAVGYAVALLDGDRVVAERLVRKPFADLSGLRSPLMGVRRRVRVRAITAGGQEVPVLTLDVAYAPPARGTAP